MRRLGRVVLVVGLVVGLAACLSAEQQATARSTAVGDVRLQTLLSSHAYTVDRVAPRQLPTLSLDEAVVDVQFRRAVPASSWPLDSCGTVQDQAFTGVRWLIDLKAKRILAVSQILANGTSCLTR